MMKLSLLFVSLLISTALSAQILQVGDIDNRDGEIQLLKLEKGTDIFRPDSIERHQVRAHGLSLKMKMNHGKNKKEIMPFTLELRSKKGKHLLNSDGQFSLTETCTQNPGMSFRVAHVFDNKKYVIALRKTYELLFEMKCGEEVTLVFDQKSEAGEIMGIVDILETALDKFKSLGLDGFWKKQIKFRFPGNGDYYSYNTVNVTKGYQWDVVGHELGHAVYDQADIGSFGGGSHRIDECYTEALALSEGWASLFAAWLKVDLDDEDAQFEFMVPRRAPLHFEHIPADVCASHKNEWRVTGFLWDIIDLNPDLEDSSETSFSEFWKMTLKKRYRSAKKMAQGLVTQGYDPILMNILWEQNFLTQY